MRMNSVEESAESLLSELGICEPKDIDVEAIAYYCGAVVRYCQLTSCAARIIGTSSRAVITVDNSISLWSRQRFSIGHELGHWQFDRGKAAHLCQVKDFTGKWGNKTDPESRANQFAANLLMPTSIFQPLAEGHEMTFRSVEELTDLFETSRTATAIRLIQKGSYPAMLVCYGVEGRRWFVRGPDVPYEIWPVNELNHSTSAFEVLFGGKKQPASIEIDANYWISHREAWRYSIFEDSVKILDDAVLTMLWWKNEQQLLDL